MPSVFISPSAAASRYACISISLMDVQCASWTLSSVEKCDIGEHFAPDNKHVPRETKNKTKKKQFLCTLLCTSPLNFKAIDISISICIQKLIENDALNFWLTKYRLRLQFHNFHTSITIEIMRAHIELYAMCTWNNAQKVDNRNWYTNEHQWMSSSACVLMNNLNIWMHDDRNSHASSENNLNLNPINFCLAIIQIMHSAVR